MSSSLQITCRRTHMTADLEALIEKEADKLNRICDRISHISVVIELPSRHHRHGDLYHARVEIDVPGRRLVASQGPDEGGDTADPRTSVTAAFRAALRALRRYSKRRVQRYRASAQQWADTGAA